MITLRRIIMGAAVLTAWWGQCVLAQSSKTADTKAVERGRYIAKIGGCNDCHTPGFGQAGGNVPENQWLVGSELGWRGPWGTTYASNLRLYMQKLSENEWVTAAKSAQLRPPMPWWALHEMADEDLRALYHFIRYLGPAGVMAPDFLPPGQEPKGPFVLIPGPPK
jgi:mono/diheme cytochrome c family protein